MLHDVVGVILCRFILCHTIPTVLRLVSFVGVRRVEYITTSQYVPGTVSIPIMYESLYQFIIVLIDCFCVVGYGVCPLCWSRIFSEF